MTKQHSLKTILYSSKKNTQKTHNNIQVKKQKKKNKQYSSKKTTTKNKNNIKVTPSAISRAECETVLSDCFYSIAL